MLHNSQDDLQTDSFL